MSLIIKRNKHVYYSSQELETSEKIFFQNETYDSYSHPVQGVEFRVEKIKYLISVQMYSVIEIQRLLNFKNRFTSILFAECFIIKTIHTNFIKFIINKHKYS